MKVHLELFLLHGEIRCMFVKRLEYGEGCWNLEGERRKSEIITQGSGSLLPFQLYLDLDNRSPIEPTPS